MILTLEMGTLDLGCYGWPARLSPAYSRAGGGGWEGHLTAACWKAPLV